MRAAACVTLAATVVGAHAAVAAAPWTPQQLVAAVNAAIAGGTPSLTVPPGVYNFTAAGLSHLDITNARDFTLSADGALFVFPPAGGGIAITNGDGVGLEGLTIDYSPLAFTQGAVSDATYHVAANGWTYVHFQLHVDAGFPTMEAIYALTPSYHKVYLWDAGSRSLLHAQVETSPALSNFTRLSDSVYDIWMHLPSTIGDWQPPTGTPLLATVSSSISQAVLCINCTDTAVTNVTVWSSSGMGYLEAGGAGGTVIRNWRAVRPPSGAAQPDNRLLVTTIDGVHSTSVERGLTLVDSEVSWAGDDLFAIHCELGIAWGAPSGAESASGSGTNNSALYIVDTGGATARTVALAQPGDQLFFFALNDTMDPLGVATVASIAYVDNATLQAQAANASIDIQRELGYTIRDVSAAAYLVLVTFQPPGLPPAVLPRFSSLVQHQERCGRGTTVVNTYLHDTSGGMRLKGVDVTLDGSTLANAYGARMLPEAFWTQSVSFNVTITNSVLTDVGNAPASPDAIAYYPDTCTGLVLANNTVIPAPNSTVSRPDMRR